MGWWRKWEQSGQQALLLQEKPPVGNSVLIPCGGEQAAGRVAGASLQLQLMLAFPGGLRQAGRRHRYCQATGFLGAAAGAGQRCGQLWPEVWAGTLGCCHVPCASRGKKLHPGSCLVGSYCNTSTQPVQDGQSGTRPGSEQCLYVCQALPAAFPPSSEGQILSIAPALKSLLPITVRNSPGLGVSYLW